MTRTWWDTQSHPTAADDELRRGALDAAAKTVGFETFRDYATHDLANPNPFHGNSRITFDYVMFILGGAHPHIEALRERIVELEGDVRTLRGQLAHRAGGWGGD